MSAGQHIALPVIGGLAVAYLDRIASGDTTRAAIVMTEFVSVWPDFRADFARELAEQNGQPTSVPLPASLRPEWGGPTRDALVLSLMSSASTPVWNAATDALAESSIADLRPRALAIMNAIPQSSPLRRYVRIASGSISSIPTGLDAAIAGTVAEGVVGPAQLPPPAPPAPPSRSSAPFVAEPTRIVGQTGSATSSSWAWWAVGGAVGVGLLIYAGVRISNASAEA